MSLFSTMEAQQASYDAYVASFSLSTQQQVQTILEHLQSECTENPMETNLWNPWLHWDARYDDAQGPKRRVQNLTAYLLPRLGRAKYIIIAEAMGYQGGRFTGIPITCERMVLGFHKTVKAMHISPISLWRTSSTTSSALKEIQWKQGFNEPTDTVVWSNILAAGLDPMDVLLWNLCPYHPSKPHNGLTNRTPTEAEQAMGWRIVEHLLATHAKLGGMVDTIFGVGKKAAHMLETHGVAAVALRHPANGGAKLYGEQFFQKIRNI